MRTLTASTIATVLAITLIGCSSKSLVVFLVRHGEKADLSEDAELSAAGRERAVELARTLRSAKIEYVHSSDFIRTRETAAPTASEYALEEELYDPRDLPEEDLWHYGPSGSAPFPPPHVEADASGGRCPRLADCGSARHAGQGQTNGTYGRRRPWSG